MADRKSYPQEVDEITSKKSSEVYGCSLKGLAEVELQNWRQWERLQQYWRREEISTVRLLVLQKGGYTIIQTEV